MDTITTPADARDERNQWCFACGPKNPFGLKLSFREQDDTYLSEFTGQQQHQGYDGIMHGGIVSTLLDEIMARYLYAKGMNAVTARLEIRYNKPTPIGVPLLLGIYAQFKISSAYQKNSQIGSRGRITGREAAEAVMASDTTSSTTIKPSTGLRWRMKSMLVSFGMM